MGAGKDKIAGKTTGPYAEYINRVDSAMGEIMKSLHASRPDYLKNMHITIPQFMILEALFKKGALKMSQLGQELGATMSNATGLVGRLIRTGFLRRRQHPRDRRVVLVQLAERGRQALDKIKRERRRIFRQLLSGLSDRDRADYLRVIIKFAQIIKEQREEKK